jgi:hypothetical protein
MGVRVRVWFAVLLGFQVPRLACFRAKKCTHYTPVPKAECTSLLLLRIDVLYNR